MIEKIKVSNLDAVGLMDILDFDCSPLPKERDSIYILFYRFFNETSFTAYLDGRLVGILLGILDQKNNKHAYLHYLVVNNSIRKKGIGTALMDTFLHTLKEKGCKTISLMTSNYENEKYYERFGYKADFDTQKKIENDPVFKYLYNKKNMRFYSRSI
jgi:GNAT superfamily N-acetyltransferase